MAKTIMHKRFGCTESDYGTQGHNKLWYVTAFDNGDVKTEYGRTGAPLTENTKNHGSSESALKEAEKLIKKKMKGKKKKGSDERDSVYTELEIAEITVGSKGGKISGKSLQQKASEQIAGGDKIVESLVNKFAKENVHNITSNTSMQYDDTTGLFTTPAGVIGQTAIDSGRLALSKIRPFVKKGDTENPKGSKLIDEYLRSVPQDVGRNRPSINVICGTMPEYDKQVSILDSLQASLDMLDSKDDAADKKTVEEKIWNITMKLNTDNKIFKAVDKLYRKTHQSRHACGHLQVDSIFDIDHHGMSKDFEAKGRKMSNVWDLWHGTRVGNILSILSKGMIIPPSNQSHCTGRMFSDGLYFSDQSTKSLNYAYGYWGGGSSDNSCYMFLVEVAMGKFDVPRGPTSRKPAAGYDSYFAKANQSGVMNNEMIVFNTYQARPKYLIKFSK